MAKRKTAAGKRVNYSLISMGSDEGVSMYAMIKALIQSHHEELTNATIALAWALAWKADVDGRCTIGKCRKASDLDRELVKIDFVILLSAEFWRAAKEPQRIALLDHELHHATVRLDRDGEPVRDERGRVCYRMRKHDIEEFSGVVQRYGLYKRDLETFAAAIRSGPSQQSLLDTLTSHQPGLPDCSVTLTPKPSKPWKVKPGPRPA